MIVHRLTLFNLFLICSSVYAIETPGSKRNNKRVALKKDVKRALLVESLPGQNIPSEHKSIHKRDSESDDDEFIEKPGPAEPSPPAPPFEKITISFPVGNISITDDNSVIESLDKYERKKGRLDKVPPHSDSDLNLISGAKSEHSMDDPRIGDSPSKNPKKHGKKVDSHFETILQIQIEEQGSQQPSLKDAKPTAKVIETKNPHLLSPNHEAQSKDGDIQTAQEYTALLKESLFGKPASNPDGDGGDDGPTLFTVVNSDVGRPWEQIPYREKFQWFLEDAPCFTFKINIPDEHTGHEVLPICIYRRQLEFKEESALIVHREENDYDVYEQRERKVSGQVKGVRGSAVFGRFVQTYFYGEISMNDPDTGIQTVYVVEEIKLLSRLLRHSHKLVNNLLSVMENTKSSSANATGVKFNAVVTKEASIANFISNPDTKSGKHSQSFVILSTSQNSYITSGEPITKLDENGRLIFTTRGNVITVDTDESVKLRTRNKEYTFRPHGKTMVSKGMNAEALREKEGVIAVTALTKGMTYSCVMPSPSFTTSRKGGFLCKVCLAADKSFLERYLQNANIDGTVNNLLGQTIDKVSWIFRSVDWNNDGASDDVGLDYDLQYIHWNYPDLDEENVSEEGLEILFKSLATVDFSDCCLGISFTMKMFPPDIYAKSSPSKPMTPGGACAIRNDGLSNNAILISANSKKGNYSTLTEDQLIYLTAHEVAKSFGATKDTSGQAGCDSFEDSNGNARHYLLWPDVLRQVTAEEKSFSNCSKKSIYEGLSSCKSSCFDIDRHPFCGNGIQEEGEECDCGNEHKCSTQYCCYGRSGKFPCRKTGGPCDTNNSATIRGLTLIIPFSIYLTCAFNSGG